MLSRPGGQLALVVTPTLTMVTLAPLFETDLLLRVVAHLVYIFGIVSKDQCRTLRAQLARGIGTLLSMST